VYFIATAYYLSPAVRSYWEKQLGAPVVWYGTTLEMLTDHFEKTEAARAGTPSATTK